MKKLILPLILVLAACGDDTSPLKPDLKQVLINNSPYALESTKRSGSNCSYDYIDNLPEFLTFTKPIDNIQPAEPTNTNFNDLFGDQYLVDVNVFTALLIRENTSTLDHSILIFNHTEEMGFELVDTAGVKIDNTSFTLHFYEEGQLCFRVRYE